MTDIVPARSQNAPAPAPVAGLRLRLWLACLGGALVSAGGIWWVIGAEIAPRPQLDLMSAVAWLGAVAGLGVVVGAAFAFWMDHAIVGHARALTQAIVTRQIARMRGLPAASGWGELSVLTQQIQEIVVQQRSAERAAEELGLVRDQLGILRDALERWNETERWPELKADSGPLGSAIDALNRGLRRLDDLRDQNLEASRQIAGELERALESARESSGQAEAGFIEATALLTTLRELHRLESELQRSLGSDASSPAPAEAVSQAARAAIEELVAGSADVVERLARGLRRVEGIGEQVSQLANRATLIALEDAFGRAEGDRAEQTRQLVSEVRAAVDRMAGLRRELDDEVTTAGERMKDVRRRVAARLERLPASGGPSAAPELAERLLDRVREMIQDATRKGERLSAAGERASRAAESLVRRLEAETREMEGLQIRLAPVSGPEWASAGRAERPPASGGNPAGLRLLGEDDLLAPPDETPGAGESR